MIKVQPLDWQRRFPWDEEDAHRARLALADAGLYPTGDLEGDPDISLYELKLRAAIHQVVDKLTLTDLRPVFNLARLLALIPRDPAIFEYIERRSALILALSGYDLQELAKVR